MSVTKDKSNGTWMVQFYQTDIQGKRKHRKKRGFKTKREAKEWERVHCGAVPINDILFQEFVNIYFEDKKYELKERSISTKKHMINKHILPYFGKKKLSEVTSPDIIAWQNMMREKDYEDTYLRTIRNQLTALYTHAVKFYHLPTNPSTMVAKMGKTDAKGIEFWTLDEYNEFLSHIDPATRHFTIFEILFWTGMRVGELLALTKEDIDLNKNQIRVNKTYHREHKTDIITTPKSDSSYRVIDIPVFLSEELSSYMDKIYDLREDQRLFPVVAEAIQHKLQREIKKWGLKYIHVHCLRHSCAAYLISQDVPPIVIKERLGHKDIRITLNTYGHLYPNRQREVADLLDRNVSMMDRQFQRKDVD
ncbi:MAG: site-specific integrase [Lachnospiraceae bacterium]|nr:site-specific integrase [Lachnospiraceae bacterium]MDO4966914.1 site-specific integrase [Lachnospiraceae bacterium]